MEQQAIFSYSSLEVAENHFKQALAQDPAFTDARLALVRNYLMKNGTGLINDEELKERVNPLISQVREQYPDDHLARAFEENIIENPDDIKYSNIKSLQDYDF